MLKNKKIIVLLPMKEHSERIPNKNIKLFNGQPLFSIILQKIISIEFIDEIIINTDSDYISESALKYSNKITIINRPNSLCGDFISMNSIIKHDLSNSVGDIYIQTHTTNPLLNKKTLISAIEKFSLDNFNFDSIFSVSEFKTRFYWKNCKSINHDLSSEIKRTQDLEPLFAENSCFYIFSKDSFIKSKNNRIGVNPYMFKLNQYEAIDIDEPQDFSFAEKLYKLIKEK